MTVAETLAAAWAAVQEAKLPVELREAGFREALNLINAEGTPGRTPPPRKQASRTGRRSSPPASKQSDVDDDDQSIASVSQEDFYARLSDETEVSIDKLERVFHLDGNTPQISLRAGSLGGTIANRQRAVGQLITVARVIGLGESDVPMTVLREECDRLRCKNSNINSALAKLDGITYLGPNTARKLKPKAEAERVFAELIDRLLGVASE